MNNYFLKNILFILFLSFFYPQWAMWGNPSLPVGSADKGVGLGAGEIMFTGDYIYQSIDWEHSELIDEPFDHFGLLNSNILNIGLTVGLNDYWNVSLSQLFVERCMVWESRDEDGDLESSVHHRTECSSDDFVNSKGGYLGDAR